MEFCDPSNMSHTWRNLIIPRRRFAWGVGRCVLHHERTGRRHKALVEQEPKREELRDFA